MGLDPPRVPVGLFQLRPEGFRHGRRQIESRDEHQGFKGLQQEMGEKDPGLRPEELVDLYLVSGRHRPWRGRLRHDLRRRYSRLLHEWWRQQGERQSGLRAVRRQPGRNGADAQRLDLVACHVQLLKAERRRLDVHAVGFFFNDTATTEIYTLSLHDALPISYSGWPLFSIRPYMCTPHSLQACR